MPARYHSALTLLLGAVSLASLPVAPRVTPRADPVPTLDLRLPLQNDTVRFAVIGDSGTGGREQYAVATQMETYRAAVGYKFVIMLGDNIYGGHSPSDFTAKFERPYAPLLSAGVAFYASLGNHDDPRDEENYKPFHMNGQRYYTYSKGDADFFVLDSDYMDAGQLAWIAQKLAASHADWKIAYFHHPLYSDGKFHGSDLDLRSRLLPIFQAHGVNAVFSGHDHVYERLKPQDGIYFFVEGDSGQLRYKNLRHADDEAAGEDTAQDFMLIELSPNTMYFQTVSLAGATVDSGSEPRQQLPAGN